MLKYVNYDIVFQEFPDEVTLAINLSLCPVGCPGCHSQFLQTDVGELLTPERLQALIDSYDGEITCVGLMGGDNDPAAVGELFALVRRVYGDKLKTGWYSGRAQLPKDFNPRLFDYVKLGRGARPTQSGNDQSAPLSLRRWTTNGHHRALP